ncbi:YwiB family protein [Acidaminobacterium chupaoyuni]
MKKDVIISISGRQDYEDQSPEKVELVTNGQYYLRGGKYYIVYEESALTGMEGTKTTMKIEPDALTILRTGAVSSQLRLCAGQRHTALYQSNYGPLNISTITQSLTSQLGEDGGFLEVSYAVEVDHVYTNTNYLRLEIRPA